MKVFFSLTKCQDEDAKGKVLAEGHGVCFRVLSCWFLLVFEEADDGEGRRGGSEPEKGLASLFEGGAAATTTLSISRRERILQSLPPSSLRRRQRLLLRVGIA